MPGRFYPDPGVACFSWDWTDLGACGQMATTWRHPLYTRKRTYARPAIPATLRPGQTWAGVFGGPGSVARGKLINVTFGRFVPSGETSGFNWITQSAFKL